jgi:hypothetical protein
MAGIRESAARLAKETAHNEDAASIAVHKRAEGLDPAWLLAIAGANGADLASTEYALSKNPNAVEANPLLRGSAGKRAAIKGAMTIGEILATKFVGKSNPKAAKTLATILTALPAALTINNLRQAKK